MRYLKILIAVLLVILISLVVYAYLVFGLKIGKSKTLNTALKNATQEPIADLVNPDVINNFNDVTSANSTSTQPIKIEGRFQAVDRVENIINDVTYSYVMGVVRNDGALSRIWLIDSEYEQIKTVVTGTGKVLPGEPVIVNLTPTTVTVVKNHN